MSKLICGSRLSVVVFIVCAFSGFASFADKPEAARKTFSFSELGQKASEKADSSSLGIKAVDNGAEIVCKLQAIEASVKASGISVKSTAADRGGEFSMKVAGLGRVSHRLSQVSEDAIVKVSKDCVQIVRPELVEEYTVSGDGIRQDFIVSKRPEGSGTLSLAVGLSGATAEISGSGLKIRLTEAGRDFAYSKLLVTDAAGKKLPAEFKLTSSNRFVINVNDSGAVYPVRIDPTISDVNWVGMFPGGVDGEVYVLAFDSSGNLYAGGEFTTAAGITVNNIAKWDGSNWSALGTGVDGSVSALVFDSSGNLYIGGSFINADGIIVSNIAKWDSSALAWSAVGTGVNSEVNALAFDSSGNLYVGGDFTTAGGLSCNYIAKWDGNEWGPLGSGIGNTVQALAFDSSGNLYAGGDFTMAGGVSCKYIAKWSTGVWSSLGTGMNNSVNALAFDSSGNLYAGGQFTTAGGLSCKLVAKWNGSAWSAIGTGIDNYFEVQALTFDSSGNLYVGGEFTTAGGVKVNNIAKWNGSTWSALGPGVYDFVSSIVFDSSGKLYAGGAVSVGIWNGSAWSNLVTGTDGAVMALAFDSNGNLYVGGEFATAGGITVNNIAKWNGSAWSALGSGVDGPVSALAYDPSGNIYAGGRNLTSAGGVTVQGGAKWNIATSKWSALGAVDSYGASCNALIFKAGNLYYGGNYTDDEGIHYGVGKWNGSTWTWLGIGMDNDVYSIAFDSSGNLYAGGIFTTADDVIVNGIAKWNGSKWSALGSGVAGSGITGSVLALAFNSGNLYAGGEFSYAGEVEAANIAKWNVATSAWSSMGIGMDRVVYALACDSSGNLYAGGNFSVIGEAMVSYIAKWDGSEWNSFGSGTDGAVSALVFDATGKLYVGGLFTTAGGKASANLAKCVLSAPAGAPTAVTAVRGNTKATVSFTAPVSDGGSPITLYEVTSAPEGIKATGSASPIALTRLTNGKSYTFTVKATNAIGPYGPASAASAAVIPATVPDAPTKVTATAGNGQATVAFTAPAFNGGSVITGYTVTSDPEGISKTGTASPLTVSGLTNGIAYKFTVTVSNVLGTSDPSDASAPVTPMAKILTAAISGVTAPVTGATPVTAATETAEYTAAVAWSGNPVTFAANTQYIATITMTPKTGRTLTGVAANFFKVAGATTSNAINSGVVTAVFPKTAVTIANKVIAGVTVPVKGATAVTAATATVEYTAGISWSPALVSGKFVPATKYTATITIKPKAGYTLNGVGENFFTVSGATEGNAANSGVVTAEFLQTADGPVAIAAIAGVTAPVTGATPVTAATETSEYTATVAWNGSPVTFAGNMVYTATITLTPKTGHTLTGVAANFFKVAGTTTVTNPVNSGVVTAVFPKTAVTISKPAIAGVTAPVKGATAVNAATATVEYTAVVTWSPAPVSGKFAAGTEYTATIILTPKAGYTLSGVGNNFFTVTGVTATNAANSGVVTAEFPKTATDQITAIAAITPAAKVGVVLTAGALTPAGATADYKWKICDTAAGSYDYIAGATGKTYTPGPDDVKKFIKVEAIGTGGYQPSTKTSAATASVAASVPGAPTIGTATPGNAQATVEFAAPISNGGSDIKTYTVTSAPGGKTATGPAASPLTVTGLTNGTAYTFTVKATNAIGASLASAASAAVTPVAPVSVTLQPSSMSVMAGDPAFFKVTVSGTLPSYQWQVSADGGIMWTDLENNMESCSGVNTATLTVINTTAAISRNQYRCVAGNSAGPATSDAAVLRIAPADLNFSGTDDFATPDNWSAPTMSPGKSGLLTFINNSMEYTAATTSRDDVVIREWTANVGSYIKNWEVQVDVHLAAMDLLNGQYANLNLVVANAADATNPFISEVTDNMNSICVAIDRYNNGAGTVHNFWRDLNSNYTGRRTDFLEVEDSSADAALKISFNCFTKELTSWYDADGAIGGYNWIPLQTVKIGNGADYDWGMNDKSTFTVFLVGGAGGSTLEPVSISSGDAYFTNFQASTVADSNYLVIDLSGGIDATSYPVSYLDSLPDPIPDDYRTTMLVLKKITTGNFTMGSPAGELGRYPDETQHQVTLKKDFYIGVFEVTQKQWERVMGDWPSYFNNTDVCEVRPVECVSYNDIRGNSAGKGWPANSNVDATSFMGKLRQKTGLETLDLPTEAQWEYSCRAGTTSALNNGTNLASAGQDANMDLLGRYLHNGGSASNSDCGLANGTAKVGSYLPNGWGLYDMHGNVWEWCLDWYGRYPGTVTDPTGLVSGDHRAMRGGGLSDSGEDCRSAIRDGSIPTYGNDGCYSGFRLIRVAP